VPEQLLDQVRLAAMALPEVIEMISHRAPCFYVRKRAMCRFHSAEFASDDRPSLWCQSPPGVAAELTAAEPTRFFQPQPSAGGVFASWLGVFLDGDGPDAVDWGEIAAILEDAYRRVAPKKLIAQLETRAKPDI
jgi:hypothetical protein